MSRPSKHTARSLIANLVVAGALIALWVGFVIVALNMWSEVPS